jgi:hypothetical protein
MCHQNLSPGEDGWKIHLMGKEGCKHNPRRIPALNRGTYMYLCLLPMSIIQYLLPDDRNVTVKLRYLYVQLADGERVQVADLTLARDCHKRPRPRRDKHFVFYSPS